MSFKFSKDPAGSSASSTHIPSIFLHCSNAVGFPSKYSIWKYYKYKDRVFIQQTINQMFTSSSLYPNLAANFFQSFFIISESFSTISGLILFSLTCSVLSASIVSGSCFKKLYSCSGTSAGGISSGSILISAWVYKKEIVFVSQLQ